MVYKKRNLDEPERKMPVTGEFQRNQFFFGGRVASI